MRDNRSRIKPGQNITRKYFSHFIRHQKKYIFLVTILLFFIQIVSNLLAEKPLISGSESYYILSLSEQGIHHNPLVNLVHVVPESLTFLIPLAIGLFLIMMLFNLSRNFLDKETTFFFILFLVLTPSFIFSFVTISSYASFLLLVLLGFFLISKDNIKLRYLSLLPFILATMFDLFSTLLLLVVQFIYYSKNKIKKDKLAFHAFIITAVLLIFNQLVFRIPTVMGPFHKQDLFADLFSDLGGLSGLSLFLIILSFIGLAETFKRKDFTSLYLLPLLIPAYLFNTNVIFFLTIITSLLASLGFLRLVGRNWNLPALKKFTVVLLILGILFSTLAYMDRISEYQPLKEDEEALSWIKENTPPNSVILSAPENSHLIRYFAGRTPLYVFENGNWKEKKELSETIFTALYIQDLFPLLDLSGVDFIYVSRDMKSSLPKDRGFLFLLKNERFKLIYSSGDSEVWVYNKENGN